MTRVIAFINPGLALLNSVEYTNLVDHFNALHAQLDLNIANNGAFFILNLLISDFYIIFSINVN
ncbi:unnamed protein product [Arabidopsis halleri]